MCIRDRTNSVVILNRENKVFSYGNKKYFDYEKVKDSLWYQETMEADGQLCWFTDQKDEDLSLIHISFRVIYNDPEVMRFTREQYPDTVREKEYVKMCIRDRFPPPQLY